jgi:hypothetical protein
VISVRAFLAGVASIVDERPKYKLGMDGTGRLCDCIGLVIGGVRRAGGTWVGTHGSNWAARNAMRGLHDLYSMDLGEVVYKAREPGEASWGLPDAYAGHPDRRDYYHAGVVTSIAPLRITHCTSGGGVNGIKVDSKIGNWAWGGKLKMVDYGDEDIVDEPDLMWTTAETGRTVNMRAKPDPKSITVARVPIDTEVEASGQSGDWRRVSYAGKSGWILSNYLTAVPPFVVEDINPAEQHIANLEALIDWLRTLQAN